MIDNMGMYQGYNVEGTAELKVTPDNMDVNMTSACNTMKGCVLAPIYECPVERCIHKQIIHEVPQE